MGEIIKFHTSSSDSSKKIDGIKDRGGLGGKVKKVLKDAFFEEVPGSNQENEDVDNSTDNDQNDREKIEYFNTKEFALECLKKLQYKMYLLECKYKKGDKVTLGSNFFSSIESLIQKIDLALSGKKEGEIIELTSTPQFIEKEVKDVKNKIKDVVATCMSIGEENLSPEELAYYRGEIKNLLDYLDRLLVQRNSQRISGK